LEPEVGSCKISCRFSLSGWSLKTIMMAAVWPVSKLKSNATSELRTEIVDWEVKMNDIRRLRDVHCIGETRQGCRRWNCTVRWQDNPEPINQTSTRARDLRLIGTSVRINISNIETTRNTIYVVYSCFLEITMTIIDKN